MESLRSLAVVLALSILAACSSGPHEAIVGTWRSDREATLAKVDACDCVTDEQRAWLAENLGELVVTYTTQEMTARVGEWTDGGPYAVVAEGSNWVELRRTDLTDEESVVHRVWVEGDRLWVRVEDPGFDQVFVRVD
jgi:hypothetical protein